MLILWRHLQFAHALHNTRLLRRVAQVEVLLLRQVELLGSEDGAGASNSDPANERLRVDLIVLHGVEADERTGTAQTSFAMHGDGASPWFSEVLLARVHELLDDGVGWCRAVGEDHILVIDSLRKEAVALVLGLVQADYLRHVQVLEDVDVASGIMTVAVDGVARINGTHEGEELAWDDPVEVAVFDLLVVLVLTSVERLEVVPSELDALLEALKAVLDGAFVVAVAATGIPKWAQVRRVLFELLEGLLSIHLQNNNHECAHQVGRVGKLDVVGGLGVVIDACGSLEAVALEQLLQLTAEPVCH